MSTVSLTSFDDIIAARSLLKHPFYVKWSKGELTLGDLKVYAKEYYHLVQRIPGIVSRVRDRALDRDPALLRQMEKNIAEEQQHVQLWERFARSLGVSEQELKQHVPSRGAQEAVARLERLADEGFEQGVAAVYALERELPAIAQTKKEGLCLYYGLTTVDAHCYFDEHLHEEEHLTVWRAIPVAIAQQQAALESMDAQNQVLDAVCDACGIGMDC